MTKKELVKIIATYYNKPQSYFQKEPKEALEYLFEEEIMPDLFLSNLLLN